MNLFRCSSQTKMFQRLIYPSYTRYYCHYINKIGIDYLNEALSYTKSTPTNPIEKCRIDNAVKYIDKAIQNITYTIDDEGYQIGRKEYVHAKLLEAVLLKHKGDIQNALDCFQKFETNSIPLFDCENKLVHMGLAECNIQMGNYALALKQALQALEFDESYPRGKYIVGKIFFEHFDQIKLSEHFISDAVLTFKKLPSSEQYYSLLDEISNLELNEDNCTLNRKTHPLLSSPITYPYFSIDTENNDIGIILTLLSIEPTQLFITGSRKPNIIEEPIWFSSPEFSTSRMKRIEKFALQEVCSVYPKKSKILVLDDIFDSLPPNSVNYYRESLEFKNSKESTREKWEVLLFHINRFPLYSSGIRFNMKLCKNYFEFFHKYMLFSEDENGYFEYILSPCFQENGWYIINNLNNIPDNELPEPIFTKHKGRYVCINELLLTALYCNAASGIIVRRSKNEINYQWNALLETKPNALKTILHSTDLNITTQNQYSFKTRSLKQTNNIFRRIVNEIKALIQ